MVVSGEFDDGNGCHDSYLLFKFVEYWNSLLLNLETNTSSDSLTHVTNSES